MKNESTYWLFFELLWRDNFKLIAEKWCSQLFSGMKPESPAPAPAPGTLRGDYDPAVDFAAWCRGETGDRFVDANMRELNATGWMPNRGRQNVASHLVKALHADRRRGASYFEAMLIEYDAASNWGNWAYLAGVGEDGLDRAFNFEKQAEIYDPKGTYRDRWCPPIS